MTPRAHHIDALEERWEALPRTLSAESRLRLRSAVDVQNRVLRRAFRKNRPGALIEMHPSMSSIRFSGVAGHVVLSNFTFHVRPKFMLEDNWMKRFVRLASLGLMHAPNSVALLPGSVAAAAQNVVLADLLSNYFVSLLERAINDHPLWLYRRRQANRTYARGRLLVHRHALSPPHRKHTLPCAYSELTTDNQTVRLLRWACQVLESRCSFASSRRRLRSVLSRLPHVTRDGPPSLQQLESLPPSAKTYREPVRIAAELLRTGAAGRAAEREGLSSSSMTTLAVSMKDSFEGLVSRLMEGAARELGMQHQRQHEITLARRTTKNVGSPKRIAKPDDVLFSWHSHDAARRVYSLTVDAKYKGRLKRPSDRHLMKQFRLSSEDFYQVVSASLASDSDAGLLIQPRVEDLPEEVAFSERWVVDQKAALREPLLIGVIQLDLELLTAFDDLILLRGQILEALEELRSARSELSL